MGKKLYVGNLTYGVTDSTLQQMFEPHGTVQSAQVIMDRDTGRSKGFGFVEMGTDAEAQAAITALSPTPPVPKTMMLVPAVTPRATNTEAAPVWIPQPSGPSSASGSAGSTLIASRAATSEWVANEDCPNQRDAIGSPSASCTGLVAATPTPVRLRGKKVSQ